MTLTPVALPTLPAASRACADSVCVPLASPVVSQLIEYGLVVTAAPRFALSSVNCTLVTPTLSLAVAETVTVLETVAPEAGMVTETVGGVVSRVLLVEKIASPLMDSTPLEFLERTR